MSPVAVTIDVPVAPPESVLEPVHPLLTPGHTLTPLSAAAHSADIDPFTLHTPLERPLPETIEESHDHLEPSSHDVQLSAEPEVANDADAVSRELPSAEPATSSAEGDASGVPEASPASQELGHDASAVVHTDEPDFAHDAAAVPSESFSAPEASDEAAEPATTDVHESQVSSEHEVQESYVPAIGDVAEAPTRVADEQYDEEDDISDPSDEDLYQRPPAVLLRQEGAEYYLFGLPENQASSSSITVLFADRLNLYYEPCSELFQAIRQVPAFADKHLYDELGLCATLLALTISEVCCSIRGLSFD